MSVMSTVGGNFHLVTMLALLSVRYCICVLKKKKKIFRQPILLNTF